MRGEDEERWKRGEEMRGEARLCQMVPIVTVSLRDHNVLGNSFFFLMRPCGVVSRNER